MAVSAFAAITIVEKTIDGCCHHCDSGTDRWIDAKSIDESNVYKSLFDVVSYEQSPQKCEITGAAFDDNPSLLKCATSRAMATFRSRPQAMILAINGSKSADMTSPSMKPVSTRRPGPDGRTNRTSRPGAGGIVMGIFGAYSCFDGPTSRSEFNVI